MKTKTDNFYLFFYVLWAICIICLGIFFASVFGYIMISFMKLSGCGC